MSKHIVSGAVALLMVLVPVGASALSYEIPAIPQNPSVQQLQQLIVQLTTLLQQIIASRTSPLPTPPNYCPVYSAPLCAPGEHLVGGEYLSNGCQAAPRCVPDTETPVGGASISFVGISGATYRIGDTVDWTINYFNAPSDSNICLVITSDSSTWEGGFQGFGGSD
ncbi:MAG: hypothetical protein KBD06_00240, partial [Candidatus Pacebacteria bacterium]|nr:hypothetical protein [Candidatus Paceibacterota bacterium]